MLGSQASPRPFLPLNRALNKPWIKVVKIACMSLFWCSCIGAKSRQRDWLPDNGWVSCAGVAEKPVIEDSNGFAGKQQIEAVWIVGAAVRGSETETMECLHARGLFCLVERDESEEPNGALSDKSSIRQ